MRRALPALAILLATSCASPARGVPIFLWHAVGEGTQHDPVDIVPAEFEAELDLLEEYGAHPITLTQLFDAREGKGTLPPRPVVLTFDDGRECLFDHVLPALVRHHMVAELFLVTDYLGADEAHRIRIPSEFGPHPYLLVSEAEAMARSGAFVIESHSVTHANFEHLDAAQQRRELTVSREALRSHFGAAVDFFSYPFGAYRFLDRTLPEEAGYRGALAVTKGFDTRYTLHRVSFWRGDTERLRRLLEKELGPPIRTGPPAS